MAWARASRKRVFLVSFSARRVLEFGTWDRMWMPMPFTRGCLMCQEWDNNVPRNADAETVEHHRQNLQDALNEVTAASDAKAGRAG